MHIVDKVEALLYYANNTVIQRDELDGRRTL